MGQYQCLFSLGPLQELWWGFVRWESQPPHLTPATDSCKTLAGSFSASQCTAGQYSLHFSQKNLKYLGRGICMICRRRDKGLPCLPSEQSPSTHSHPVVAGLVGRGTISTPAKMWSWAKKLSLCLEKANGWLISASCLVTSLFLKAWCFQVW